MYFITAETSTAIKIKAIWKTFLVLLHWAILDNVNYIKSYILASYACNGEKLMSNITNSSISLFCAYGTLNEIVEFGQTKASQNVSCANEGANFRFTMPECSYSEKYDKV